MKNSSVILALVGMFLFISCQQGPPINPTAEAALKEQQAEAEAITTVQAFYKNWNEKNLEACASLIAANAIDHMGDLQVVGVDSIMVAVRRFSNAFPDSHFEIEKITATGNLVMAYGTWTGTHQGDFGPFKATNKKYSIKDVDLLTVNSEGKLTEHWSVQESCGMAAQLGWVTK